MRQNFFPGYDNDEFYHVFNHGVEDCLITRDRLDSERFLILLELLNKKSVVGSVADALDVLEPNVRDSLAVAGLKLHKKEDRLVEVVAYCLNPNHFHLLLKQVSDNGVPNFLQKLSMAYCKYINTKYHRKGTLFYGTYGRRHISTDEYLIHASAYINLNYKVHNIQGSNLNLVRSSWEEYTDNKSGICDRDLVMASFSCPDEYREYALSALETMRENKIDKQEMREIGIDL